MTALAERPPWHLFVGDISSVEAERAALLLSALTHVKGTDNRKAPQPEIHVLGLGSGLREFERESTDALWIVRSTEKGVRVHPAVEYPWYEAREVLLLVDLSPISS